MTRVIDRLIDAVVGAIATWTLAYHIALVADLRKAHAVLLFAVLALAAAVFAVVRMRRTAAPTPPGPVAPVKAALPGVLPFAVGAIAAVVAVVAALAGAALAFSLVALGTVAATLVWAITRSEREDGPTDPPSVLHLAAVVAIAIVFAGLVTIVHSPTGDDTYYVNRAMYIEANDGPFPTKDTIFADQLYPSVIPPDAIAGYEALVGVTGWATGIDPRTIYYLVFAPMFAALGVLTVWRFARSARAHAAGLVVAVAIGYLLMAGRPGRWGAVALHRIYEGKSVLAWFGVVWLWHHATEYARTGDRRSLFWMFVGGIAAVGVSSSGAFIAPLVFVAALAPLLLLRDGDAWATRAKRVLRGLAAAAYPAVATLLGALSLSVYASAESPERRVRSSIDAWTYTLGPGRELFFTATVVLVGWSIVRSRHRRIGLGVASLGLAILFTPIGLEALDLVGMKQLASRFWWVLPLPALIGLAVDATLRWNGAKGKVACAGAIVLCAGLMAGEAARPQSIFNSTFRRPAWNVDQAPLRSAERLVELAGPRSVVAAPPKVSALVANVDPSVHAVNPRAGYTSRLDTAVSPAFRGEERLIVTDALAGKAAGRRAVARALRVLEVEAVCTPDPVTAKLLEALTNEGFRPAGHDARCRYWSKR